MEAKTKNIITIVVVIILAALLVYIMYFVGTPTNTEPEEVQTPAETVISNNIVDTSPEPLSMAQVYFNESLAIEPQGAKSQVVHGVIFPVLKMIFNLTPATPDEAVVDNVKLKISENDNKLVYVFNRVCTNDDVENFKIALKTMGATVKNENNPVKIEYSSMNFTFNFLIDDQQKGEVEISF